MQLPIDVLIVLDIGCDLWSGDEHLLVTVGLLGKNDFLKMSLLEESGQRIDCWIKSPRIDAGKGGQRFLKARLMHT